MIYSSDLTGKRKGMDDIPNASLTQKGITKVINSMESDDETSAISINTVRELCELANTVKGKIPKSKVTINGINGTNFTISKSGTNISGSIGSNGKTIVEISELGNYTIVGNYNGKSVTTTVNIDSVGLYEVDLYVSVSFADDPYELISKMSKSGKVSSLYSIGDTKAVTLNGSVGDSLTFDNTTAYMQILAFDHNSNVEMNGEHHMICGFGKMTSNGNDTCFVDRACGSYTSLSTQQYLTMNTTATNSGGWASSGMRSIICFAFKNALPNDLQTVLRSRTIYTNNTGYSSDSSAITSTTDIVYIPSEFEIFGSITYANSYEQNYQKRLSYYSNGNSTIRYKHGFNEEATNWWLRSSRYNYGNSFSIASITNNTPTLYQSHYSWGFFPIITI